MRIAIVGNACAGKTVLSRKLAKIYSLPVVHVDSIQFLAGMKIRSHQESIKILRAAALEENWIIEGYGPLDIIEERFLIADRIILIDLSLRRHYFWALKRQFQNFLSPRVELPEGCRETSLAQSIKLFKSIRIVHKQMRSELLKIFERDHLKPKMIIIRSLRDLKRISKQGF